MSATIRGVQPLRFGSVVTTGYVTESVSTNTTSEELLIDDEAGDVASHISGYGVKHEVTLEVIPKASTTKPAAGDVFTYGAGGDALKIVVKDVDEKQVKKDVMKWTIKGSRFPNIALS